jgi:hypothetical protein
MAGSDALLWRFADARGGVKTGAAGEEKTQGDETKDRAEELFGANTTGVLKHGNDEQSQEQAQERGNDASED